MFSSLIIRPDTLKRLWKSAKSWQRLAIALCWTDPRTGGSLHRALPILMDEHKETGGILNSNSLMMMSKLDEQPDTPLYLLEHLAEIHPQIEEVHLLKTETKSKASIESGIYGNIPLQFAVGLVLIHFRPRTAHQKNCYAHQQDTDNAKSQLYDAHTRGGQPLPVSGSSFFL